MRARAAVLAVALLAALPLADAASAQSVDPPVQSRFGAVRVIFTDIGPPLTGDFGSVLRLSATIVNDTPEPQTRVRWRLRIGPQVNTRAGLTTTFAEQGPSAVLWHDDEQVVDVLPAGASHQVYLSLPLDRLEEFSTPSGPAIFPIRFEVTHRLETTIATADTFLIWFPGQQPTLRLGWVVAITDAPARDASGALRGDDLAKSTAPGGRLDAVLSSLERGEALAGAKLPLTLAVDAELVESVNAMAKERGPAGSATATSWLDRLKALASRHPVIALPYADPDVVALVRAGLTADLTASFGRARDHTAGLDALLGITAIEDIAWPVDEFVDSATVDRLADNGIHAVLLDRQSLRKVVDRAYTTTAAAEINTGANPLTAIVPDAPVTSLAIDMATGGQGFAVARQRLLAETAVIQQQLPYEARDVFVRFARDWQPADPEAAAALLALPVTTPWLTGTTVPDAIARPARADDRATIPRYPGAARRAELAGDALVAGNRLRGELTSFGTILADSEPPPPGATTADRTNAQTAANLIRDKIRQGVDALAWSESAHWRRDPAAAAALRSAVRDMLTGLRGQVSVAINTVRLTSTSGPLPVTLLNRLGTPVRVRLTLQSQRLGLKFGKVRESIVAAARSATQPGSTSVEVPFEAQTVGKFPVDAQLSTVDDLKLGPPSRITVSTTAYGRLALLVTGGAFVLLVLAALVRFVFRRRQGKRPEPPGDGFGGPGEGEGPGPETGSAEQPMASAATGP